MPIALFLVNPDKVFKEINFLECLIGNVYTQKILEIIKTPYFFSRLIKR
jgi:hypothetical protein